MFLDLLILFITGLVVLAEWLEGDTPWFMGMIFTCLLTAIYLRERQHRIREDFLNQLKLSRKELRAGGTVLIDGRCLRYDTELTTYSATVGGLLTVVEIPSAFQFPDDGRSVGTHLFSLLSIISGWWAPAGPIHTLVVLHQNVSGGKKQRVCELVDNAHLQKTLLSEIKTFPPKNSQSLHNISTSVRL